MPAYPLAYAIRQYRKQRRPAPVAAPAPASAPVVSIEFAAGLMIGAMFVLAAAILVIVVS